MSPETCINLSDNDTIQQQSKTARFIWMYKNQDGPWMEKSNLGYTFCGLGCVMQLYARNKQA
jgi:hypothetical protein